MDWADEIESTILRGTGVNGPDGGVIATAIRKAKADGMREAADEMLLRTQIPKDSPNMVSKAIAEIIYAAADNLQPPTE